MKFSLLFTKFAKVTGFADLVGGLPVLQKIQEHTLLELRQITGDYRRAQLNDIELAEAVTQFDNYPYLARFHAGVLDSMLWALPKPLVSWSRRMFQPSPTTEMLAGRYLQLLVSTARGSKDADFRAAAELMLFQMVRTGLLFEIDLTQPQGTHILANDRMISRLAESSVRAWLSDPETDDALVIDHALESASAAISLRAMDFAAALRSVEDAVAEAEYRDQQRLMLLRELDLPDALLLRNYTASSFQEQPVSFALLKERHPIAFDELSENAMSQRLTRLKARLADGDIAGARRRSPNMLDLVREAVTQSH